MKPISQIIMNRYSPKQFLEQAISGDEMEQLFIGMQQAPSCYNEQPWRVFYAEKESNPTLFKTILDLLAEGNQAWAKDASVLMITAVSTVFDRNGKTNAWASHDLGLAMGQLGLLATSMDIGIHQMGGFDADKAEKALQFPEDWKAVTAVALGKISPKDGSLDKSRKSIDSFTFKQPYAHETSNSSIAQ